MGRTISLCFAILWGFVVAAVAQDPIIIDIDTEVTFNNEIATDGYWEFQVENEMYEIDIVSDITTQVAGVYTLADLDLEWSSIIIKSPYKKVTFVAANLTLTETNTSHTLEGTITGNDGIIYQIRLFSGVPTAQTTVNVVIPSWTFENGYELTGMQSQVFYGMSEDGIYVQITVRGRNKTGQFTYADCVDTHTRLEVANAEKTIYSLTANISEYSSGIMNITADILCTNNTLYHVTTTAPPVQTGVGNVNAAKKATKRLINDQVVIEKDGKMYDTNGVSHHIF